MGVVSASIAFMPKLGKFLLASQQRLNSRPRHVFYFSRTAINLLGVDRFAEGFSFVTLVDCWDGAHPNVFVPKAQPRVRPRGNVEIAHWLLRSPEVQAHVANETPEGVTPQVVFAFFNEETERICRELGYEILSPSAALREHLDSKITTTQLGDSVGVESAPNILTRSDSWEDLKAQAIAAGLGDDLVVQTPYGHSGETTFFISNEAEHRSVATKLQGAELKVMRRINHRAFAADVVATRWGPVIGPVLAEIAGHEELTDNPGGWVGNDLAADLISESELRTVRETISKFSESLFREGYRGIHEVSVLLDTDTGAAYLGELNPRMSGALATSNVPVGVFSNLPLFGLHLLEYAVAENGAEGDAETFSLDTAAVNEAELLAQLDGSTGNWGHLMIQHTGATERITSAPRTGRYRVEADGSLTFLAPDLDWHGIEGDDEAFCLRVMGEGEYRTHGEIIALGVTRKRLQDNAGELTDNAHTLVAGVRSLYEGKKLSIFGKLVRKVRLLTLAIASK